MGVPTPWSGSTAIPQTVFPTTYTFNNKLPNWIDPSRQNLDESATITAEDRQSTFNAEGGILPIVYGRQRVGSKLFIIKSYADTLVVGAAFCEGPIDSFITVEVNDTVLNESVVTANGLATVVTTYSGLISLEAFLGSQTTPSPMLVAAMAGSTPSYTDTLVSSTEKYYTTYAVLTLQPNSTTGFPNISAEIKGMKVYDPRDARQSPTDNTTWTWSDNPALCLADLISSTAYGLGRDVDWDSVAEVANFNDEEVGFPPDVSRTLNLVIDAQQNTTDWIETLRGYASCFVVPSSSGFKLIPDRPVGYSFSCTGNTNTYCLVPYVDAHELTNEISLEVNIKPDVLGTGIGTVLAKGDDYRLEYAYPTTTSVGSLCFSFTDTVSTAVRTFTIPGTLPVTDFTSISISIRKNLNYILQIDGVVKDNEDLVEVITRTTSTTIAFANTISQQICIGKKYINSTLVSSNPFMGYIDEVRLWNRARTLTEIQDTYRKLINSTHDNSMILHLPFNEGLASISWAIGDPPTAAATNSHVTIDKTNYVTAGITLTCPTGVSPWYQHDGSYDFFSFDGTNILAGSTKFSKRGAANVPTIVEVTYTDTTRKPWSDNFVRTELTGTNKIRLSSIPLPGITRSTQAMREAIERYNTLRLADTTLNFSALDDTLSLTVGSTFQFHHPIIETEGTFFFKPYRITSLQQVGAGKWSIGAVEYDPSIYSDYVTNTESYRDTNIPRVDNPPAPEVYADPEQVLNRVQTGVYTSRVKWKFYPPTDYPFVDQYRVTLYSGSSKDESKKLEEVLISSRTTDGLITYVSGSNLNLIASDGSAAPFTLSAKSISVTGVYSTQSLDVNFTLPGKTEKPGNVPQSSFRAFEAGGKVYISWTEAVDLDITGYELRYISGGGATDDASIESQWDTATVINVVSGYKYTATFIPTGNIRFFVKAVDSVRNKSEKAAYYDAVVDTDDAVFFLAAADLTYSGTDSSNVTSFSVRPDPKLYWITDFGGTWDTDGDQLTNALTDTIAGYVVPQPHPSATSVWTSVAHDFGTSAGGVYYSGYVSVAEDVRILSGTVNKYIEHSTDGTAWTQVSGSSAVLTTRYVRFRVEGVASTDAVFVVPDNITCSFGIITREESGITTTAHIGGSAGPTETAYAVITLSREYSIAKSIQLTPRSNALNYSVAYEDISLGATSTFKVYVIDVNNYMIPNIEVSWIFKGL